MARNRTEHVNDVNDMTDAGIANGTAQYISAFKVAIKAAYDAQRIFEGLVPA